MALSIPKHEEEEYEEQQQTHSRFFHWGLILALVSMIGFTVAANVNINGDNKVEFGQGIYKITSCDQFVGISLNPTAAYGDGYSRVLNVYVAGLDVVRCANTSIRIKLYDSTTVTPMNLFTNPQYTKSGVTYPCCTETGTSVTMVIAANATLATALQSTTLLSPSGKNIAQGDRSQSLTYDSQAGIFSIAFTVPLAIMRDVYRTTLESAPNV